MKPIFHGDYIEFQDIVTPDQVEGLIKTYDATGYEKELYGGQG